MLLIKKFYLFFFHMIFFNLKKTFSFLLNPLKSSREKKNSKFLNMTETNSTGSFKFR